MDWQSMRASLRFDLKDTSDTPKWSDEELYNFWLDAVRDYSMWFPRVPDRETLSGSSTGPYTLPSDLVEVLFVEVPEGRFLEERVPKPGVRYPSQTGRPFYWYLMGGTLFLDSAPMDSDEVLLTYSGVHAIPENVTDNDSLITIPDKDLELPRLYVQAKAYSQMRHKQSSLDRFKTRVSSGDTRMDNPLRPEVDVLMQEYYAKISERVPGGYVRLIRPGRRR